MSALEDLLIASGHSIQEAASVCNIPLIVLKSIAAGYQPVTMGLAMQIATLVDIDKGDVLRACPGGVYLPTVNATEEMGRQLGPGVPFEVRDRTAITGTSSSVAGQGLTLDFSPTFA